MDGLPQRYLLLAVSLLNGQTSLYIGTLDPTYRSLCSPHPLLLSVCKTTGVIRVCHVRRFIPEVCVGTLEDMVSSTCK